MPHNRGFPWNLTCDVMSLVGFVTTGMEYISARAGQLTVSRCFCNSNARRSHACVERLLLDDCSELMFASATHIS